MTLEEILEHYEDVELLKADGFDGAVIGIELRQNRLVYDVNKMIEILIIRDNMSEDEALEYIEFNVIGAYVGEQTPIYVKI
jgi:hypothetical protein